MLEGPSVTNHRSVWLLALFLASCLTARIEAQTRVVAYVPNWIEVAEFSRTIAYDKVTHLNIAFENPVDATGALSFNEEDTVLIQAAHAHGVKVLVSIGGGSASTDSAMRQRYDALLNKDRRSGFVAQLTRYVLQHGFDGLDVDLEGPAINADYGAFIAELSAALKPKGKLLTAALSRGYGGDKVPKTAFEHLDFINIMAYDDTGPWEPENPGQHSSLEFAQKNITWWLERGLTKNKAVLGVPFYGYGFGKSFKKSDYSYAKIIAAHPGAENKDEAGDTIFYNGLPTIRAKTRLVIDQGLGGVMIWPLNHDAQGKFSLLNAIHELLPAAP